MSQTQPHPIRKARQARNWSQADLAERLNPKVTKGTVSQWESDITQPLPEFGLQLVDLFGGAFSLEDLYRRTRGNA